MRRRLAVHRHVPGHAPSNRLAWWAAFLATITLIVLLNAVRADAAPAPGGGPSLPHRALVEPEEAEDALGEEEDGFEELEECEGDEEEVEECVEEGGAEGDGASSGCALLRAEAKLSLSPAGAMRLTIRYTAYPPTTVAIEYSSRGPKGSLRFDGERHRLDGAGTLREREHLSRHQTAQAMAAHSFMVELRPLGASLTCQRHLELRLPLKRSSRHSSIWLAA